MKIITVAQALAILDTGQPCHVVCVTYDRSRKKGGKLLELDCRLEKKATTDSTIGQRPPTEFEAKLAALKEPGGSKNPNHQQWYTRNIRPLANGHPLTDLVKIHPPLLVQFNGMTVVP
jgi:hypothetical protein